MKLSIRSTFVAAGPLLALACFVSAATAQLKPPPPRTATFGGPPRVESTAPALTAYNAKASPGLLKELHKRLEAVEPYSTANKLHRVELAARIIQVDLALGEKGSGNFYGLEIKPDEAAEVRRLLRQMSLKDLNDLSLANSRAVLWSAIGSAHPVYRIYVEGARLAGHTDDPRVLDRTIRSLKDEWKGDKKEKAPEVSMEVFDEGARNTLLEMLRYQAVANLEDAARLMSEIPVSPPRQSHRSPAPTDPAARAPRALHAAVGGLDQYEKLAHVGAALARRGFEATYWSLAIHEAVDEFTKTLVDEPLVVFPARQGEPALVALGEDGLLAPLGGDQLAPGVYLFADAAPIHSLAAMRGQARVPLDEVLEGQASLAAWSAALQKAFERTTEDDEPRRLLLGLKAPTPFSSFTRLANASLLVQPQARFLEQLQRNRAKLQIGEVQADDQIARAFFDDPATRAEKDILLGHESAVGRAFQMLPIKMSPRISAVTLQNKPVKEKISTAVTEGSKVVVKEVERLVPGRAWPGQIYLASPSVTHAIHECMHAWALARLEPFELGEWKGNAVTPFNNISWEQGGGRGWERRTGERILVEDYLWDYGATNQNEDLAVIGQYYVLFPRHFREIARSQMRSGNFVPMAKYLYMKYVAFLDTDGRSLEYGLDAEEGGLSLSEFESRLIALQRAGRDLTDEQERLVEVVRIIAELSFKMAESQRIVSSLVSPPKTDV